MNSQIKLGVIIAPDLSFRVLYIIPLQVSQTIIDILRFLPNKWLEPFAHEKEANGGIGYHDSDAQFLRMMIVDLSFQVVFLGWWFTTSCVLDVMADGKSMSLGWFLHSSASSPVFFTPETIRSFYPLVSPDLSRASANDNLMPQRHQNSRNHWCIRH